MSDYRARIYAKYATVFKDEAPTFNFAHAVNVARAYHRYFRGWLPDRKDARIVDVACGNGNLLYTFREAGYTDVRGVDISGEQVALARQVVPNVEEGDVLEYLRRHPDHFDLITGVDIIEHMTKDEVLNFLDTCFAALRPGGRLILQTPNANNPFFGRIRYGDFTHEVCFVAESLGRLMTLCGYTQVEPRELGPVYLRPTDLVRIAVWKLIRVGCRIWNLAETGSTERGVFTRVFTISGVRR